MAGKQTTRQRMERFSNKLTSKELHDPEYMLAYVDEMATVIADLLKEHRRLRAKVRKLHQRYTTGIYGDSPVDYFVEDLLKVMR